MTIYHPNAITVDGERLFTTNGTTSYSKAIEQFEIWESHYGYKIKTAWVDDGVRKNYYEKSWHFTHSVGEPQDYPN